MRCHHRRRPLYHLPGAGRRHQSRGDRKAVILAGSLECSCWVKDLSAIAIWLGAAEHPVFRVLTRALAHPPWKIGCLAGQRFALGLVRSVTLSPDVPVQAPALG